MAVQYSPNANTMALYHLEDVKDSSGNGKDLSNVNGTALAVGLFGNCADFGSANVNKSLWIADTLVAKNAQRTVIGWVKISTELVGADKTYDIFSTYYGGTNVLYEFTYRRVSNVNSIYFKRDRVGVGKEEVSYNVSLGTTTWHMLAYTVGATNLSIYLDGQPVGVPVAFNTGDGTTVYTAGFFLGCFNNSGGYASMLLDEVIVDNTCWTSAKILAYYFGGSGNIGITPASMMF
jgi:hypothetical protein